MKPSPQQFEQIAKSLQYIEDHLTEPICIEDISQHVNYSLYHFSRVFNAVTLISPYTYLIRRRISEAAIQVVHTRRRLTDIAVDYGFQSSEVFARSFRRLFNAPPSELRKKKVLDSRLLLSALPGDQLNDWQDFHNISLKKEQSQTLTAYGLLTHCDGTPQALEDIWREMHQQYQPPGNSQKIGIRFFPAQWEKKGIYYFNGYQFNDHLADLPPWFVQKEIPAQDMLMPTASISAQHTTSFLQYLSSVWFPISSYQAKLPFVIETYSNNDSEVQLMIPAQNKAGHQQ
ncbi:MAG: AraC family transcriptional regulator [Anaerolineaceae bacterium]|nr:AraC family transcriptional regulator [Anaerolineaceae bacterium]